MLLLIIYLIKIKTIKFSDNIYNYFNIIVKNCLIVFVNM